MWKSKTLLKSLVSIENFRLFFLIHYLQYPYYCIFAALKNSEKLKRLKTENFVVESLYFENARRLAGISPKIKTRFPQKPLPCFV